MLQCEAPEGVYLMVIQNLGYVHGEDGGGVYSHTMRKGSQGNKSPAGPELVSPL